MGRARSAVDGLTAPGLKVALCAEAVPCGAAAKTAIAASGVTVTPVTLEQDVKAVLAKVATVEQPRFALLSQDHTDAFFAANDPLKDRATFKFCGTVTKPGRFTIREPLGHLGVGAQVICSSASMPTSSFLPSAAVT